MSQDVKRDDPFDEGYQGISRSELEIMSDLQLAEWQAGWKQGTAKHILAEKEWQRRLSLRLLQEQFRLDSRLADATNKAMRFAAIVGVVGTLAGAGLGTFATFKTSSVQTSESLSQGRAEPEVSKAQSIPVKVPGASASK